MVASLLLTHQPLRCTNMRRTLLLAAAGAADPRCSWSALPRLTICFSFCFTIFHCFSARITGRIATCSSAAVPRAGARDQRRPFSLSVVQQACSWAACLVPSQPRGGVVWQLVFTDFRPGLSGGMHASCRALHRSGDFPAFTMITKSPVSTWGAKSACAYRTAG